MYEKNVTNWKQLTQPFFNFYLKILIKNTVFNNIREPIIQCQTKVTEASLSYHKSYRYSGKMKPPIMLGRSVGNLFMVGEPPTEVCSALRYISLWTRQHKIILHMSSMRSMFAAFSKGGHMIAKPQIECKVNIAFCICCILPLASLEMLFLCAGKQY